MSEIFLLFAAVIAGAMVAVPLHSWSWEWRERHDFLPGGWYVRAHHPDGHVSWHGSSVDRFVIEDLANFWRSRGISAEVVDATKEVRRQVRAWRRLPPRPMPVGADR